MDIEELRRESVIEKLYHGEIFPCEQIKSPTAESRDIDKQIEKMVAEIGEHMENGSEVLEKLGNLYYERMEQETQAAFTYGLKLGLRLMAEATSK